MTRIETLDTPQVADLLLSISRRIVASEDTLAKADRDIGDGDHGQGMTRGFSAVITFLQGTELSMSPSELLRGTGSILIASMGGASGVVFGTLFRATPAASFQGPLTIPTLANHFALAANEISRRGGAVAGQKTMLDALIPATESLNASAQHFDDIPSAFKNAAEATLTGVEATKFMVARHGKASTLGERTLGFPDAGAISVSIIFEEMSDWATRQQSLAASTN